MLDKKSLKLVLFFIFFCRVFSYHYLTVRLPGPSVSTHYYQDIHHNRLQRKVPWDKIDRFSWMIQLFNPSLMKPFHMAHISTVCLVFLILFYFFSFHIHISSLTMSSRAIISSLKIELFCHNVLCTAKTLAVCQDMLPVWLPVFRQINFTSV